jgi:hypothetical protein
LSPTLADLDARVSPRAGLGPFLRGPGEPGTIAYFGASVTVQRDGYRPRLHEMLRRRHGELRSLYAGFGGVGIVSAAFLADELVVSHAPDLCLIEYTSARPDPGRGAKDAGAAMEGIVLKLLEAGIRPCILHLYRRDWDSRWAKTRDAFERVAERHGLPSIDLATGFLARARAGELDEARLFRDVVHTTPAGSELVAELTDRALGEITTSSGGSRSTPRGEPTEAGFRDAHVVPALQDDALGPSAMGRFRLHWPYLEIGPSSAIRKRIECRIEGFVIIVGPHSGELEVSDGTASQRVMTWDDTCFYERLSTAILPRGCSAGADVKIQLTDTVPDYASCRRPLEPPAQRSLRLVGYMVRPG